jgi:hypothetical protein
MFSATVAPQIDVVSNDPACMYVGPDDSTNLANNLVMDDADAGCVSVPSVFAGEQSSTFKDVCVVNERQSLTNVPHNFNHGAHTMPTSLSPFHSADCFSSPTLSFSSRRLEVRGRSSRPPLPANTTSVTKRFSPDSSDVGRGNVSHNFG